MSRHFQKIPVVAVMLKVWQRWVLALLLGMTSSVWANDVQDTAPQGQSLLILGDSLSAGYGITLEKSWPSLLQQKLKTQSHLNGANIQVVNASISGETTSGGISRLPGLLQTYHPRWVVLELGANDALRGQNLQRTQHNLAKMIEMSQNAGVQVLLLGIRLPTNYGPAYDLQLQKMYQFLAGRYEVLFDPFFLEDVALDSDLMQTDALHPNEVAQPMILKRLWPKFASLLQWN